MLFGNSNRNLGVPGLFASYGLDTPLQIGVDAGYWIGNLAGFRNGTVLLREAQLFSSAGRLLQRTHPNTSVPLNSITFVSEAPTRRPLLREQGLELLQKIQTLKRSLGGNLSNIVNSVESRVSQTTQETINEVLDNDQ